MTTLQTIATIGSKRQRDAVKKLKWAYKQNIKGFDKVWQYVEEGRDDLARIEAKSATRVLNSAKKDAMYELELNSLELHEWVLEKFRI